MPTAIVQRPAAQMEVLVSSMEEALTCRKIFPFLASTTATNMPRCRGCYFVGLSKLRN